MFFGVCYNKDICVIFLKEGEYMNLGLVTIFGIANYGNMLQRFATHRVLEGMGHYCESIVKVDRIVAQYYHVLQSKNINAFKRSRLFYSFFKENMKYKNIMNNLNRYNKFDYIICGSDQVWNPYYRGREFYFADFVAPEKRIAYSSSFGVSEIPEEQQAMFKKYISEMKSISVREDAGQDIISELCNKESTVLIDPTLMLDKEEYLKVAKKPKFEINKKYILTYFLSECSAEHKAYIKSLADKYDMDVIDLNEQSPNNFWYKTGPAELLWLIENASLVCTNSYHGTIFSILMNTPFIVFERENTSMTSRHKTLFRTLNMSGRTYAEILADNSLDIFQKCDDNVYEILKNERARSIQYLENAMK